MDRNELWQALITYFNESELKTLCFSLYIDYESLSGLGKNDKARELIEYCERYGRTHELITAIRQSQLPSPFSFTSYGRPLGLYPPVQLHAQDHHFIDRQEVLAHIQEAIESVNLVCIYGPPGVGKTALANRLARQLYENNPAQFPDGVLWSDLETASNIESLLEQVLSLYRVDPIYDNIWKVTESVLANKRALWILDGANRALHGRGIANLIRIRGNCAILITSRDSEVIDGYKEELPLLSPEDSLALFQTMSKRGKEDEEQYAHEICARLGHLPLAICIAANWVGSRAQRRKSLSRLQQQLEQMSPLDLSTPNPVVQPKEQNVRASFEVSWQDLESDQLRQAFACSGVFAGNDWDVATVAAILACALDEAEDLLDQLVNKSLLEGGRTETRYSAHPLLHEYARNKLDRSDELYWRAAEYYRALVVDAYYQLRGSQVVVVTQQLILELNNLQGIWRFCREQSNQQAMDVVRSLLPHLWEFLLGRGYFGLATNLFTCAEELAINFNDEGTLAEVHYGRACLTMSRQSTNEARNQLQAVAETYRKQASQKRCCDVLLDLAYLSIDTGELEQAEEYAQQVFGMARQIGQTIELGRAHLVLGLILSERGLITEAITHFEEALELFRSQGNLLLMYVAQRDIARQYRIKGDSKTALGYFEEALQFFQRAQHMRHIDFTQLEIANTHLQIGQIAEAKQFYVQTLEGAQSRMNHWVIGAAICGLAQVELTQGNLETALNWYKQAMVHAKETGASHKQAVVLQGIAEVFIQKDQLKTASNYLRQALELQQSAIYREETFFAIAYLLVTHDMVSLDRITDTLKFLVTKDSERALLLVTLAQLAQEQNPELVIKIGDLLSTIDYPIQHLNLPKSLQKEFAQIKTVGKLLAAILQKTIKLSKRNLKQVLVKAGYWPRKTELTNTSRYTSTMYWGGGGCFPQGTKILLPSGNMCVIEKLEVGMSILAKDIDKGENLDGYIEKIYFGKAESYYLINNVLRVTGTHALWTNRGWIIVKHLQLGDYLYDKSGQLVEVNQIEHINERLNIYNIELLYTHTFFANGFLVHNKDDAWPPQ